MDKQKCAYFVRTKLTQSNPNMKRKSPLKTFGMCVLATLLIACSDNYSEFNPFNQGGTPLLLTGSIEQECLTRINDYGFVSGDRMGIYVVDYSNGQAGQLHASDNRASNVLYTFNADTYTWSAPTILYWRDSETPVDVYGYYPGANAICDPMAYTFEVQADQNIPSADGSISSYEQSDLLWGKVSRVKPTTEAIVVKYNHILAGVRVNLQKGTGISDTEWEKLEKIVLVDNTIRTSTVDLSTGTVTPTGSVDRGIRMLQQSEDYRAVVIPQTVAAGKTLISITIDGTTYSHTLTSPMKYQTGKLHNFTITINKRAASGDYELKFTDGGITPWTNDESSHQFSATTYVTVHCDAIGTLKECIAKAGYDYQTIQNLKVTGELTSEDYFFMRDEMPELKHLNLKETKCRKNHYSYWSDEKQTDVEYWVDDELPSDAFYTNKNLRSLILPSSIKTIGVNAFREMRLMYSTLEVPEGVTKIGKDAFSYNEYNGVELILPYSLDSIMEYAFYHCAYKSELRLTDNITHIGESAFGGWQERGCLNFHGVFHIPSKLKKLSADMFSGLGSDGSITGEIEFPQGITEIPDQMFGISYDMLLCKTAFKNRVAVSIPNGVRRIGDKAFPGMRFSSLYMSDDVTEIGEEAFYDASLSFPIMLPSSLRSIGSSCFLGCGIEGELIIPENCLSIEERAFSRNAITKLTLPSKLESISNEVFKGNPCLTELTIPKFVDYIGERAFAGCIGLQTVICLNPEPPFMRPNAFGASDDWSYDAVSLDKVILQVPEASVEAYRHADGWKDFKNITAYHELAFNIPEILTLDKGNTLEGIIRAEGAWEVTECPDWCTVSPMSGTKQERKAEITITVKPFNSTGSREGRIVFKLADKDYTTYTTVRQVAGDYKEDAKIILQKASAGAPREIPIFLVGDGYDADDIVSGQYLADMREQMEYLFSCEPYKTYRKYFTVSTAIACSPESGINGRTRFNTECYGSLIGENDAIWKYAKAHGEGISEQRSGQCTVVVLLNTNQTCNATDIAPNGRTITLMGKSTDTYPYEQREFVLREVGGIAFGKLAEESVSHFTFLKACTCPGCNQWEKYFEAKSRGWYENITVSGKMNEAPWAHLIFDPRYSALVDFYEGGYNHARGVYRSEPQSIMSTYIPYFNTISRESIVRRIMNYAGETYTFEKFVEKDKMEIPE